MFKAPALYIKLDFFFCIIVQLSTLNIECITLYLQPAVKILGFSFLLIQTTKLRKWRVASQFSGWRHILSLSLLNYALAWDHAVKIDTDCAWCNSMTHLSLTLQHHLNHNYAITIVMELARTISCSFHWPGSSGQLGWCSHPPPEPAEGRKDFSYFQEWQILIWM